ETGGQKKRKAADSIRTEPVHQAQTSRLAEVRRDARTTRIHSALHSRSHHQERFAAPAPVCAGHTGPRAAAVAQPRPAASATGQYAAGGARPARTALAQHP